MGQQLAHVRIMAPSDSPSIPLDFRPAVGKFNAGRVEVGYDPFDVSHLNGDRKLVLRLAKLRDARAERMESRSRMVSMPGVSISPLPVGHSQYKRLL